MDYADYLADRAGEDFPIECSDCGVEDWSSRMLDWECKDGGMEWTEPVCPKCWDARDRREMAYTRLKIEQMGKRIFAGFVLAACFFGLGYVVYKGLEAIQGLF